MSADDPFPFINHVSLLPQASQGPSDPNTMLLQHADRNTDEALHGDSDEPPQLTTSAPSEHGEPDLPVLPGASHSSNRPTSSSTHLSSPSKEEETLIRTSQQSYRLSVQDCISSLASSPPQSNDSVVPEHSPHPPEPWVHISTKIKALHNPRDARGHATSTG